MVGVIMVAWAAKVNRAVEIEHRGRGLKGSYHRGI